MIAGDPLGSCRSHSIRPIAGPSRRARKLRVTEIDFSKNPGKIIHHPLDKEKKRDYEDIIPAK